MRDVYAKGNGAVPECLLRAANGTPGIGCDGEECVYWRTVAQLDLATEPTPRECAIQYFRMLEGGSEVAAWLLSVKRRVESGGSVPDGS